MAWHDDGKIRFEIVFNLGVSENKERFVEVDESNNEVNVIVTLEELERHVAAMQELIEAHKHL